MNSLFLIQLSERFFLYWKDLNKEKRSYELIIFLFLRMGDTTMKGFIRYAEKMFLSFVLHVFWVFPIVKDRIVLLNELSFSYGDSLKYLHKYIIENNLPYCVVFPSRKDQIEHAINVKPMSIRYFYYLLTSGAIVTNAGGVSYLPKRKGQIIINTWHGGGPYKKIGENVNGDYWSKREATLNAGKIDYFLSSCQYFTRFEMPAMYIQKDKVINSGLPRNDIFWNNDLKIKEKVFSSLRIDEGKKMVLYAPTFRGAFEDYSDLIKENGLDIDIQRVRDALTDRFGGEWVFAIRLHPKLRNVQLENIGVLNLTDYPDMQELLFAADVIITDYSSLMWDYSLTEKPCFLYAKDIEEYERTRGFYIPVSRWPYPLAHDNDEIEKIIKEFSSEQYRQKVKEHHIECGSYECGRACEKVINLLNSI